MLTATHEVRQCDSFTAELKEVRALENMWVFPGGFHAGGYWLPCDSTRDRCASSANSPLTGAGTIGGRLRASDVDGQMLLLRLCLEVGIRLDPHIG